MTAVPDHTTPPWPSTAELDRLYDELSNWGRWGDDDEAGALALITPQRRAAAAALVRSGRPVSLAHDLRWLPTPEQHTPSQHFMLASGDARDDAGLPGYEATRDYVGTDVHGLGTTHLDALCHMFVRGKMYNGQPPEAVRSTGATRNTVMSAAGGISGRGVLLDIPRVRGTAYLDGDDVVTVADLEAAESAQGSVVGEGDLLIVGLGRDARREAAGGRLDPFAGLAGLHPQCLPWLHARGVALLGSDGISDPLPARADPQWPFPVHQIGITGMGLHLVDNLRLDELTVACADERRWEFLLVIAPLRIPGGTGSPVNPVALL